MANFWDLPRPVRDKIYRLHLVEDEPISEQKHVKLTTYTRQLRAWGLTKRMPSICAISPKADREAAQIYFGENHFVFGQQKDRSQSNISRFMRATWPRHYRVIRKLTIQWPKPTQRYATWGGIAREAFLDIGRMTGLQELYVRLHEKEMVRDMLISRRPVRPRRWDLDQTFSWQDNLAVLRHPGMTGLLTLHDIPHVEFMKRFNYHGDETGGSIPGGVLETEIAPKLRGARPDRLTPQDGAFPFLELAPELRNRVYTLLLCLEGLIEPFPGLPSSAPKKCSANGRLPAPGSALSILVVNQQIHDEAVGIFYHSNQFLFRTPPQLAAFVTTLGDIRASSLRTVTLHYENVRSDGINLASISFPMLQRLTGLRRLHILSKGHVVSGLRIKFVNGTWPWVFDRCNPLKLPGIRTLFNLRGITDIKFRDTTLEEEIEALSKDKRYPDGFETDSHAEAYIRVDRIMQHFNAALADAQRSRINTKMLMDDEWQTRDEFPLLEDVHEDAANPAGPFEDDADELQGEAELDEGEMENESTAQQEDQTDDEFEAGTAEQLEAENQPQIAASNTRVGSTRYSLRRSRNEMEAETAEEDEAGGMQGASPGDHVIPPALDDVEDEIVVKHVARAKRTKVTGTYGAGDGEAEASVGPGDEDEDEDEDEMEELSYVARGQSVEL